uniref:Uncharacterized protein n=1 Tax=Triticum urartu TaxID=4572 RepID=A0A8R7QUS9_TRIUA
MSFTDFKRLWMAQKFSHIYEGRRKMNSCVFTGSLFLHCMVGYCFLQIATLPMINLSYNTTDVFTLSCLCRPSDFQKLPDSKVG